MKEKFTVSIVPAGVIAAAPDTGMDVELLKSMTKKYCFIRNTSLNDLKDQYELKTGSVFTEQ